MNAAWKDHHDGRRRAAIERQDARFCLVMKRAYFPHLTTEPEAEPRAPNPLAPAWKRILDETATKHCVSVDDIISPRRDRAILPARYEAIWRMKAETAMSLPAIGRRLGGRDHTTIINALKKYQRMAEEAAGATR